MLPQTGFTATYRFSGDRQEALSGANALRFEQTVEFPPDLTPEWITDAVVGQIVTDEPDPVGGYRVTIAYPTAVASGELTQLLNVLFGNSSIKPGIRLERFDLSLDALIPFRGPRFGRAGLRAVVQAPTRPLLCTALKPMGLSAQALARQAYQFALGGIDLIKDDHGLTDQVFSPYRDRLRACADAVAEANAKTGYRSLYLPNVTAAPEVMVERAHAAVEAGAGGLLISPGLTGFDAARRLADDDELALPLLSHPAWLGSYTVAPDAGMSHFALYGQLGRLAGIDAVVFPGWGGRFAFTREDCASIARGTAEPMGSIAPSFPAPGGGMKRERVDEQLEVYGRDVVLLIGGDLHRPGPDLADTSRRFRALAESYA